MKQDARRAPTQSTLVVTSRIIRFALLASRLSGNDQRPSVASASVIPPKRYHPARHPTVSTKTPPRTRPKEYPSGWLRPRHENAMFRPLPLGRFSATMATDEERCSARAAPWSALSATSPSPFPTSPAPMISAPPEKHPVRSTHRGPTAVAIDPERSSADAVARAETDAGQKARWAGMSRSAVMAGRPTPTRPLTALFVKFTPERVKTRWAVRRRERRAGRAGGAREDVVVGAGWMSGGSSVSEMVVTTGARAIWVVDDMVGAGELLGRWAGRVLT